MRGSVITERIGVTPLCVGRRGCSRALPSRLPSKACEYCRCIDGVPPGRDGDGSGTGGVPRSGAASIPGATHSEHQVKGSPGLRVDQPSSWRMARCWWACARGRNGCSACARGRLCRAALDPVDSFEPVGSWCLGWAMRWRREECAEDSAAKLLHRRAM